MKIQDWDAVSIAVRTAAGGAAADGRNSILRIFAAAGHYTQAVSLLLTRNCPLSRTRTAARLAASQPGKCSNCMKIDNQIINCRIEILMSLEDFERRLAPATIEQIEKLPGIVYSIAQLEQTRDALEKGLAERKEQLRLLADRLEGVPKHID